MATLLFFAEILAVALVACLFVGYGTVRTLLGEACGLILDVFKTVRSFSRTSASLAEKLENDMSQQQQQTQQQTQQQQNQSQTYTYQFKI